MRSGVFTRQHEMLGPSPSARHWAQRPGGCMSLRPQSSFVLRTQHVMPSSNDPIYTPLVSRPRQRYVITDSYVLERAIYELPKRNSITLSLNASMSLGVFLRQHEMLRASPSTRHWAQRPGGCMSLKQKSSFVLHTLIRLTEIR